MSQSVAVVDEMVEDQPALVLASEQAYVTETATGLVFSPGTPIEVWGGLVERLQRQSKVLEWAIADAINFGEQAFGEDHAQWVDESGLSKRTLQNIARIGREIPQSRRRADVSFSHHAEVITLPVPDQERLLDRAEGQGWTRYDLRDAVRERKRELAGGAVTVDGEVICSAELPWSPTKTDLVDDARAALEIRLSEMPASKRSTYESGWIAGLLWAGNEDAFREWRDV